MKKSNWIVTIRAELLKEVYCEECTEEEARRDPFSFSTWEKEVDRMNYDIKKVEENV